MTIEPLTGRYDTGEIGGTALPLTPIKLELDDSQDILSFERTGLPEETEPVHSFPQPDEPIKFDEPSIDNVYPSTEPPTDFFENLDVTLSEFKGDPVATPINLESELGLFGEVVQKPIAEIEKVINSTTETGKINIWLLLIIAALIAGVFYLSKK